MSANRLKLNTDKTELLWVRLRHSFSQQGGQLPVLHLGHDSIKARDHVRLLGVTLSSDLSLDRHTNIISATNFYRIWQLRHSRQSLDTDSATAHVHAFASSRVDHCNALLAGSPKVTDKLRHTQVRPRLVATLTQGQLSLPSLLSGYMSTSFGW